MTSSTGRLRSLLGGPSGIAVAMAVMNVTTYAFTIIAARVLGPRQYGGFASVMGLLIVLTVIQLGLQATGARRIVAAPDDVGAIEAGLIRVGYRAAAGLAVLCLVLAPLIKVGLRLDSLPTALLVALSAWPLSMTGAQAGVLQGERRWYALAVQYLAVGVPRLLVGTALLLWRPDEFMAVLGVTIGAYAPVLVGWVALRRSAAGREAPAMPEAHGTRIILGEVARNSHALLAFFALSNADVILARGVLDRHESGLYAGGLILTKAMLFLPQFVVVIAFPSMSNESQRREALIKSITLVLGLGVLGSLASWALSGLALEFVGGAEYTEIRGRLWLFAVLGTMLSMIQLLVYSVVARQARFSVYLIWGILLVFLAAGSQVRSVTALVSTVTSVDAALFLMLLGISLWRLRTGPALEAEKTARAS